MGGLRSDMGGVINSNLKKFLLLTLFPTIYYSKKNFEKKLFIKYLSDQTCFTFHLLNLQVLHKLQ